MNEERSEGCNRISRRALLEAALGLVCGPALARAAEAPRSPALTIHVASYPLALEVLRGTAPVPQGVDVAIDLFRGGRTLIPLSGALPAVYGAEYAAGFNGAIARLRGGGARRVYGVLELLRWAEHGQDRQQGALSKHPEWRAVDRVDWDGKHERAETDGVYASPYRAEARAALAELARRAGESLPALDGIVISATLSRDRFLDFSPAAREAHVRLRQIDPIDLTWQKRDTVESWDVETAAAAQWGEDQCATVSALVAEVAATYRKARPGGRVAGWGWADWCLMPADLRAHTAAAWLEWARAGTVDELWICPSRTERISDRRRVGQVARATQAAYAAGAWPLRAVLYLAPMMAQHAVLSEAQRDQDVALARKEAGGSVVLIAEDPEQLRLALSAARP